MNRRSARPINRSRGLGLLAVAGLALLVVYAAGSGALAHRLQVTELPQPPDVLKGEFFHTETTKDVYGAWTVEHALEITLRGLELSLSAPGSEQDPVIQYALVKGTWRAKGKILHAHERIRCTTQTVYDAEGGGKISAESLSKGTLRWFKDKGTFELTFVTGKAEGHFKKTYKACEEDPEVTEGEETWTIVIKGDVWFDEGSGKYRFMTSSDLVRPFMWDAKFTTKVHDRGKLEGRVR